MSLKEKIQQDLTKSLQQREALLTSTLRLLLAAITNKEKEALRRAQGKGKELSDEEVQGVAATEAKKRRESIEAFERGGRQELADKEKRELEILLSYLPEQLSEKEIQKLVKEAIQHTGASALKDMGRVMGELAPKIKGKADGSQVSRIVKELLTAG